MSLTVGWRDHAASMTLTKAGTGGRRSLLDSSGANTYHGRTTTVSAGLLTLSNALARAKQCFGHDE